MCYIKSGDIMKQEKNEALNDFFDALDKLIESKYILAERKISDVLQAIAKTSDVYNLIAKCMVNFDFKAEWRVAISAHFFKLPERDEDRIAFIFCLLGNIDDKNIDFTNFLSEFFSAANSYSAYELFSKTVIVEFKRLVMKMFNLKSETQPEGLADDEAETKKDNFDELLKLIAEMSVRVKLNEKLKHSFLGRDDLIAVLSTFALICQNRQVEYLYAFRVTLNAALAKNKIFKNEIEKINQIVDKLIRGIYE